MSENNPRKNRHGAIADKAAALFREGQSYGKIAKQLNLPSKKAAQNKVWAGMDTTPQLQRQIKEDA